MTIITSILALIAAHPIAACVIAAALLMAGLGAMASAVLLALAIKPTIKRWRTRAKKKAIAEKFTKILDEKMNARRRQWDGEEAELRAMIGLVGGSGSLNPALRPVAEMAGISARFDSALTTDDNRAHWAMADGLAADAAANPMIRYTLRNRARYEIANNCYAMGVGETIANDFVGTGPRLHIDDERLTDEERADVEVKFADWAVKIQLAKKLKTMRKAKRADGETFACKINNPKLDCPVKLDIQVIECDRVRFVDLALMLVPSVDGIRFDEYGNPVSYSILRVHPGFWSYATGFVGMPWEFDTWDASRVIHWFRQDRPEQHRGLPEILPALPLYATLRRWTQATLDAAETAADYAILLKTEAGAQFVDSNNEAIDGFELAAPFGSMALQRRMAITLPAGYDATQMKPEQPTQQYAAFKESVCGEIGRCENVPANVVLADSSNSSFASGQLDHKIYFRGHEIERSEANILILDNLLKDFIAEGVRIREGKGDMGKPYLPSSLRTLGAGVAHSWYWDSNEMGDPLKLAAAKSTQLKDGLTTIPAEYAAKGRDWKKAFVAAARSLGVTLDQYQEMVRNSIFAAKGTDPVDATDDQGGAGGKPGSAPPRSNPATKKPGQAATQKAAA